MIQQIKAPAAEPEDQGLILRTHMIEERDDSCTLSSDVNTFCGTHIHILPSSNTHTHGVTHPLAHTQSHTHRVTHSQVTHTHSHVHTYTLALSHTHSYTQSHSHTYTHTTHTYSHTFHTVTHAHKCFKLKQNTFDRDDLLCLNVNLSELSLFFHPCPLTPYLKY